MFYLLALALQNNTLEGFTFLTIEGTLMHVNSLGLTPEHINQVYCVSNHEMCSTECHC